MTKMAEISLNGFPIYEQPKKHTLWGAHTYIAHVREYLPPPPGKLKVTVHV